MSLYKHCPVRTGFSVFVMTAVVVMAAGLPVRPLKAAVKNAEDLMIVDCLLPGQIRKLGAMATYMSARRPIRTTQSDCQIRGGEYVAFDRANYQTALKVWLDQAMSGSAEAQNNVGEIYSKGLGTEPDYGMAFQWFKKAADQGYGRAKINLGYLYETGLGVTQDTAAALNLYREASGIQDELLYSSNVEIQLKAKDETIGTLQGQVATEQATSAALREQVEQLQRELNDRRNALQETQRQLQATQTKLSQAKQSQDLELTRLLETQLLSQEQQIKTQNTQIAALESRSGSLSNGSTMMAGRAVTLEILEPSFVATRGRNTAIVRGIGKRQVVGRVSVPAAIKQITVNGKAAILANNGSFTADVDVAAGGTPVKVVAVDQRGASAELDFLVLPQAGGATASTTPMAPAGNLPRDVKLGRYFAVVIGNNSYRDPSWPALKSANNDATAVANLLQSKYGYQTKLVLNGNRLEIFSAINEMREQLKPEDNLLIYYAGHGEIDGKGQGYWIPVDGAAKATSTWISNAQISDMLNTMSAKHILVVADSCYSGSMTRASAPTFNAGSMPADKWNSWVKTMVNSRSRTALTSGGVQPVPDVGSGKHSYFARAFLNALQDNNRLLEAQRLFREVSSSLALSAIDAPVSQIPQYAPIRYAGHESGEYFFQPKGGGRASP